MAEHPFPIPAEVAERACVWFERLTALPSMSMCLAVHEEDLTVLGYLEQVAANLHSIYKACEDLISEGTGPVDRIWLCKLAIEAQAAAVDNLVGWARTTWAYDPAVLAALKEKHSAVQ